MISRWFWREWRTPSLLIVWMALSLAVACVLALGSISDRMEKGLNQQSRDFMAGDRVLRSSHEVPAAWLDKARELGLKVGEQISFVTMTFSGDTPQLADVKAVDAVYPMYGTLETVPSNLKPAPGTVLISSRLKALLNLKTGDSLDVGDATLRVAGVVVQEPDAGFNPFQMAPRLMMNVADVAKTGAVQPGSRVSWRYKFGGTPEQLAQYEKWLLPQLQPEHRWYGLDQDDGALGKSLQRSQQFLLLSALLTLGLAVAAVAVAMGHYCRSRYDLVAILKTLGAGRAQLRKLIVGQWLLLLAMSALTGGLLGLLFEHFLMVLLRRASGGAACRKRLAVAVGRGQHGRDFAAGGFAAVSSAACHPAAARAAARCGGPRLAVAVLPSSYCHYRGAAAGGADGRQHAAVVGAGRGAGSGIVLRRGGLAAA